jgi:glutathione S-transferase
MQFGPRTNREVDEMSDLKNRLESSRRDVEMGVAEAEAELARLRQQCQRLEELIASGKAMMAAGQFTLGDFMSAAAVTVGEAEKSTGGKGLDLTGRGSR